MNISKGTIIRTAIWVLGVINGALVLFGKSVLPIDEAMIESAVSFAWLVGSGFVVWWKDNDFSLKARNRKATAKAIEAGSVIITEIEEIEDPEDIEDLDVEYGR